MNENKDAAQKKRLREIREAAAKPEVIAEGVRRLIAGVSRAFKITPSAAKKGIPRLSKSEVTAAKSLTTSAFKQLNPETFKIRPGQYQVGFNMGMIIEGYRMLKEEEMSPIEETMQYTLFIVYFGLGKEVNAETKKKLTELLKRFRAFYRSRTKLPPEEFAQFMKGYGDAKKFYSQGDRHFDEMDDRQQLNFLVFGLNKYNKEIRSVDELEKFAKEETQMKFKNSSDAFKKNANRIHFRGTKYSRSRIKKKKVDRLKKRSPVK